MVSRGVEEPGIDAYPVGYYDDLDHVFLKGNYRIREQKHNPYWYNMGAKGETRVHQSMAEWTSWKYHDRLG